MDALRWKWWCCASLSLCLLAGCEGWSGTISLGKSDSQNEEDTELGLDDELLMSDAEPEEEVSGEEGDGIATTAHSSRSGFEQKIENADAERLALNLNVGEKFPLVKSITQTVHQFGQGGDRRSQSKLDIMIVLTVLDHPKTGPNAGAYLFEVKYHKVKYDQNLLGQKLRFDSENIGAAVPPELQTYQRLIGNGFSFWLNADNQIGELVGFDEFLKRCLEGTASSNQVQASNLIANTTGSEGLANFVDDSIGLLPPTAIRMGDTWSMDHQVLQPIAMKISSRYSLTSLDDTSAEISILGQIAPIASASTDGKNRPLNVVVEGGQVFGSCTIDRRSGLPIHSQVNQEITMRVKMADQPEFRQKKQSITTIRAFPQQNPTAQIQLEGISDAQGILQTSGNGTTQDVRQAGGQFTPEAGGTRQADYQGIDSAR